MMRGHKPFLHGNTPTGVGKTRSGLDEGRLFLKHPHGRGEDLNVGPEADAPEETPPRAWGRHGGTVNLMGGPGNTPTGVGKTWRYG